MDSRKRRRARKVSWSPTAENWRAAPSSNCVPSYAVTILQGIQDRAGGSVAVTHVGTDVLGPADATAVAGCDAAVVVVGLTAEDEGENMFMVGGDR